MLWRSLSLVRAWSAAGLISLTTLGLSLAGEPTEPTPGSDAPSATVRVLDGQKSGDLTVEARGRGQSQVHLTIRNTSKRRLNVILPPGLVASSAVGQGAGAGGGIQSMGLGSADNRPGGFGKFAAAGPGVGFRSMPASETASAGVAVAAGQSAEIDLPAVCLNFGLPSPSAKDKMTLMDVDDYSRDGRVRVALRTLALLGTSQGTAQAAMWRVCNNVPFETMLENGGKVVNRHEVALAARFVEALDSASSTASIDPAYLTEARLFVTVEGAGSLQKDARRIATDLEGLRVLGLPVRVAASADLPKAGAPALHVVVSLTESKTGETSAKVSVRASLLSDQSRWTPLGQTSIRETSSVNVVTGADLARSLDHALSSSFVSIKATKKSANSTTFRVDNRLPFTLAHIVVKTGTSPGSPSVTMTGVGIGPARSGIVSVPSPTASIDRVELNGL